MDEASNCIKTIAPNCLREVSDYESFTNQFASSAPGGCHRFSVPRQRLCRSYPCEEQSRALHGDPFRGSDLEGEQEPESAMVGQARGSYTVDYFLYRGSDH